MALVVVEVECFQSSGDYIVKELAIVDSERCGISHYIFKSPYSLSKLGKKFRKTNNWITRNLHQLKWSDGFIEYKELVPILVSSTESARFIFSKGSEKCKFLSSLIGRPVFDFDHLCCPKIISLNISNKFCLFHSFSKNKNCALHKAVSFAKWYDKELHNL
jgi:hypothetical protein